MTEAPADEREARKAKAKQERAARKAQESDARSEARAQAKAKAAAEKEAARAARTEARVESVKTELSELRRSYYLSGAAKKIDIPTVEGFSDIAAEAVSAGRTNMNHDRLYTLWQAARAAPAGHAVAEVGTYRGGSAWLIAKTLQAAGEAPPFFVCDTFAGHARTDPDIDKTHHGADKFQEVSVEETTEYLSEFPNVTIVEGDIVETSSQLPDTSYGFVHVDVDVYPATAHCLRFFAPRLADDAMLVIDDYGFLTCPGAKQATDEFVAEFPEFRLLHLLTGQAILSGVPSARA